MASLRCFFPKLFSQVLHLDHQTEKFPCPTPGGNNFVVVVVSTLRNMISPPREVSAIRIFHCLSPVKCTPLELEGSCLLAWEVLKSDRETEQRKYRRIRKLR